MPQFHETGYGRDFFGRQLPELIRAINELTKAITKEKDLEVNHMGSKLLAKKTNDDAFPGINIVYVNEDGKEDIVSFSEFASDQHIRSGALTNKDGIISDTFRYWKR